MAYIKIIAQRIDDQWIAWFENAPQAAVRGNWPGSAVLGLLDHAGELPFELEEIVDLPEEARDGHLEFIIPLRMRRRIPSPSVN